MSNPKRCKSHGGYVGDNYPPGEQCFACQKLYDYHNPTMPLRKSDNVWDLLRLDKAELIKKMQQYQGLFLAATEQIKEADFTDLELKKYKEYLEEMRERLLKCRKERDLALELLHLRLMPHE
jgi:hypothetical protein